MSLECTHLNPLQRDGTSQRKRLLEALKPDFVKVDEREIQDWIIYARKYAKLLQYYNKQNVADGDWTLFIEKDISTLVSMISKLDTSTYKSRFKSLVESIDENNTKEENAKIFAGILVLLYEIADSLSTWYTDAIPELGLHKYMSRLITAKLEDSFAMLIVWLQKAEKLGLPLKEQGLPAISLERKSRSWPNAQAKIDIEPFHKGIPDRKKETDRELFHLDRLFKRFFEVIHALVSKAPKFLDETFTDYPEHQPHIALFLAFLNLMKVARDNMNTLTKRHLDFYYKEILQLKNRPEDPDEVHVIFELANNFDEHLIKKGTTFDAGDDGDGELRIYAADEDIVVNRATLDEDHGLKNIFVEKAYGKIIDPDTGEEVDNPDVFEIVNIYASSNADSLNGSGEDLPEDDSKWTMLGNEHLPYGEVGFAIASPLLLLKEGEREIKLSFTFDNLPELIEEYSRTVLKTELKTNIKIYLSGEEGWIEVTDKSVDVQNELVYTLELAKDVPPILPYNEEVHGSGFDTEFPVVRFIMDNEGLNTLGDLDLSLDAGLEIISANLPEPRLFLSNEFILLVEDDPSIPFGQKTVYKANGEVLTQYISDLKSPEQLWAPASLDNIDPFSNVPNTSYIPGQLILLDNGAYKRATAEITNVHPSSTLKHWRNINEDVYNPEIFYQKDSLIFHELNLYRAIPETGVKGVEPGSDDAKWQWVKEFENGETYTPGDITFSKDKYYSSLVETSDISPEDGQLIWEELSVFFPGTTYLKNDKVAFDHAGTIGIYALQAHATSIPPEKKDEDNPSQNMKIWQPVGTAPSSFPATIQQGSEIGYYNTSTSKHEVYRINAGSSKKEPNITELVWTPLVPYATAAIDIGLEVGLSNNVFKLMVGTDRTIENPSVRIEPLTSQPIWEEIDNYDALTNPGNLRAGALVGQGTTIYKLNAGNGSVSPASTDTIWEPIKAYQGLNRTAKENLTKNEKVGLGPKIYSLNAKGIKNDDNDLIGPDSSLTIWKRIERWDHPSVTSGSLAGYGNNVYKLNADANSIRPNSSIRKIWTNIVRWTSGNSIPVLGYTGHSNKIWQLRSGYSSYKSTEPGTSFVDTSGPLPVVRTPWRFIVDAQSVTGRSFWSKGVYYRQTVSGITSYYKCNELTSILDFNLNIWDNKGAAPSYNNGHTYPRSGSPFVIVKALSGSPTPLRSVDRYYQVQATSQSVSPIVNSYLPGSPTVGISDDFTNPIKIWEFEADVFPHNSDPYSRNDYVSKGNAYYQANIDNQGVAPDSGAKLWETMGKAIPVAGSSNLINSASQYVYTDESPINTDTRRFFKPLVVNTLGEDTDPPKPGDTTPIVNMWESIGVADTFVVDKDYEPYPPIISGNRDVSYIRNVEGSEVIYYKVNEIYKNTSFDKEVRVWDLKAEAYLYRSGSPSPDDETLFPREENGEENPYVVLEGVTPFEYFRANTPTIGIHPSSNIKIWGTPENPVEYSSLVEFTYPTQPFVYIKKGGIGDTSDNIYYSTEALSVEGIDPEAGLVVWQDFISNYIPEQVYQAGDAVLFSGQLYQAQASFRDIVPTSVQLLWEDFDPDNVLGFDPSTSFKVGEYTKLGNDLFKANFSTIGVSPVTDKDGNRPTIWEELETTIKLFGDQKSFQKGDHVEYKDEYYRALAKVTGIKPDADPLSWRKVGTIVDYFEQEAFYKYMHAQYLGKVYRAIKDVPSGTPPQTDTTQKDNYWIEVPKSYPYKYFHKLVINRLKILVDIKEMQDLILENDNGVIDPSKAFEPFGTVPSQGSSFYIGSHEIFQKKLAGLKPNLTLEINYGELPEIPFNTYYAHYIDPGGNSIQKKINNNQYFTADLEVLENSEWVPLESGTLELFENQAGGIPSTNRTIKIEKDIYSEREARLPEFSGFNHRLERGFVRIQLKTDFFHSDYPKSLAKEASDVNSTNVPNTPYTPLINEMKLSYTSEEEIALKGSFKRDFTDKPERFFFISPFGQATFIPVSKSKDDGEGALTSPILVPTFEATTITSDGLTFPDKQGNLPQKDANGNLFIGIRDLDTPQNLTLLFQVAEGSENPVREKQRVIWSYLEDNRWKDFTSSEIVSEGTNGLLTSGIVKLDIPRNITADNTLLPAGIYWIKASVVDYADGVAEGIAVIPQAVQASYQKQENNDPLHLQNPLPAKKITALISRQAGITEVKQPFASFGGRLKEQDEEFYVRVSERLRHKSRGITIYDYERLVLQEFPQVYKAKCLNHTLEANEQMAGKVSVVVVSELRNKNAVDKLRPILSVNARDEIEKFLQKKVNNFTEIKVISPLFEEVRVETKVEFLPGKDKGFYTKQLQKDIVRFLAPWLYDEEAELVFGNKMSSSALINFIDEQNYVDFLVDFVLHHKVNDKEGFVKVKGDEIITSTSASVLVPVVEDDHLITTNISIKC